MTAEQQLNEQGIEQHMAQARQRFRESALRLFHRCLGGEVDADVAHEVAAWIEQRIAISSVDEIELISRMLSYIVSIEDLEAWSTSVLSATTLAELFATGPVLRVDLGRE